jgi:hypothetical protein
LTIKQNIKKVSARLDKIRVAASELFLKRNKLSNDQSEVFAHLELLEGLVHKRYPEAIKAKAVKQTETPKAVKLPENYQQREISKLRGVIRLGSKKPRTR